MTPEELKNIAPKLYELHGLENSFCIPKGYFKTVDENILSLLYLDVDNKNPFDIPDNYFDLVEISALDKIKIENESVPKNYFNTIEDAVFKKIQQEPQSIFTKRSNVKKYSILAVAASILLLFTLQLSNLSGKNKFAALDLIEIENWIESGEIKFESHEVATIYENTEDLNIYNSFNDDEILDYFNGIEMELLALID